MQNVMTHKQMFAVIGLGLVELALGALKVGTPAIMLEAPAFSDKAISSSLAAFDSQSLSPMELEEMGSSIEKLVTKGDDDATRGAVKTMSDFVVKVMIPNRMRSQKDDQVQLQSKLKALEHCHLDKGVQNDMNLAEKVDRAKGHQTDYTGSKVEHGSCLEVLEGMALVEQAYCHSFEDATRACESRHLSSEKMNSIATQCCDAQNQTQRQRTKCEGSTIDIQYAKKQHNIIMNKVCEDYDSCYKTNLKAYTDFETIAKTHEETRSWSELLRVKCLVEKFKDGKVTREAARACKDNKHKINGVDYPAVPGKAECVASVK